MACIFGGEGAEDRGEEVRACVGNGAAGAEDRFVGGLWRGRVRAAGATDRLVGAVCVFDRRGGRC